MKTRTVVIQLEIETATPLKDLRQKNFWVDLLYPTVEDALALKQVQANVIAGSTQGSEKK